jgi:hypothetical protein
VALIFSIGFNKNVVDGSGSKSYFPRELKAGANCSGAAI